MGSSGSKSTSVQNSSKKDILKQTNSNMSKVSILNQANANMSKQSVVLVPDPSSGLKQNNVLNGGDGKVENIGKYPTQVKNVSGTSGDNEKINALHKNPMKLGSPRGVLIPKQEYAKKVKPEVTSWVLFKFLN